MCGWFTNAVLIGTITTNIYLYIDIITMETEDIHTRSALGLTSKYCSYKRLRKTDYFGFPIVNFPWLSGDVPSLPSYGVYISHLVRFARCCTSVSDCNFLNVQLTSKLLTQGYRYHNLKKFGKIFRSYSDLFSKFGEISFQEYVTEGIFHPVFIGDLIYKLRRVRCEVNFVSKIVKGLRHRKYNPLIIDRTIGLVLGPSTALYRSFLKYWTLTNKAVGTI